MIWGQADQDPMANDPLRLEFSGTDPEDVEGTPNQLLEDLVEKFECEEYLPFAYRLIWLSSVKEVLGYIPDWFHLSYAEIRGLVILHDESAKKLAHDNWNQKQEAQRVRTHASSSVPHVPRTPIRRYK